MKILLCLLITISFVLPACGLSDKPEEKTVITVGNRDISVGDLERDIKSITSEMGITERGPEFPIDLLVNRIVDHYLILEYGRENGIVISEEELESAIKKIKEDYEEKDFQQVLLHQYIDFEEWKETLRQQLLMKKIVTSVLEGITPVSSEEIKAYFDAHQDEFKQPAMIKFRQIVTRTEQDAENILKRLEDGEDMAELARRYSITPEADNGGVVDWIAKEDLDESIGKAVFSLPIGQIGPVVKTSYGYHIFQVLDMRHKGIKNLPEAVPEIESILFYQKETAFYRKWLKELRALFPVKVDQEVFETLELG